MDPCMVTTGFFVLARCGRAAVTACPRCQRRVCGEHHDPNGRCPECATAQGYQVNDPHDPRWAMSYRRDYRRRASRTYSDDTWFTMFNMYDRGAFEPGNDWSSGGDFDFDHDSGLVDS